MMSGRIQSILCVQRSQLPACICPSLRRVVDQPAVPAVSVRTMTSSALVPPSFASPLRRRPNNGALYCKPCGKKMDETQEDSLMKHVTSGNHDVVCAKHIQSLFLVLLLIVLRGNRLACC
mmetsp:Transcript_28989/g.48143  ORF Transcript_28989/g.48143 Transcript_28989/m.48143 type:complete len:120 (-) Transcript_28989:399-758(-)